MSHTNTWLLVVSAFAYGIRDRFTGDSEVYAGSSRINVGIFPPPLLFFPFSRLSAGEETTKRKVADANENEMGTLPTLVVHL